MPRSWVNKKNIYLNTLFDKKDKFLEEIQKTTRKEGVEKMQISAHEGRILQFLVQMAKAKKVVELGTLYAYSSLHIASALPEKGQLWTLDLSVERHKKSQEILKDSKEAKKIQWVSGLSALEGLKSIEVFAPFDMIFIDADKESYMKYLFWAEQNLRQGGLAVADNTFLFGAVYGESDRPSNPKTTEVMKEFNKRITNSKYWKGALIPTDEGLSVGVKL